MYRAARITLTGERDVVSAGDERFLSATDDDDTVARVRVGNEHETLEIFKLSTTAIIEYANVKE